MIEEIKKLIPHRYPFLFVDEIQIADEKKTVAVKTFTKKDNPMLLGSFPGTDIVPGLIVIESMAQAGGAGVKKAGLTDGVFGFATLSNVTIKNALYFEQKVLYEIDNLKVSDNIIKQSGTAYFGDKIIARADWLCIKIG